MGNRLLEKYQDVIKSIKDSTGIKIVSVEEVEDNQAFLAVKEEFDQRFSFFDVNSPISYEYSSINSVVDMKKGGMEIPINIDPHSGDIDPPSEWEDFERTTSLTVLQFFS